MDFVPGSLLEARDFSNEWFPAKVVEVDWEDREVLVHFQNWSSRYDEWICMDSARLQPINHQSEKIGAAKPTRGKDFKIGDKVMAVWHNNKKYPAQITKVLDNASFEVLFYDGFLMQIKAKQISRMSKDQADKLNVPKDVPSEAEKEKLDDMEEVGSKEERRKKNKKIEVATLFRAYNKKRCSTDTLKGPETVVKEEPLHENQPVQVNKKRDRAINRGKGPAESIKLNDAKLPIGWEKRAKMKTVGTKAGKWDVVIIGPGGRTFRSKQDIKQYIFLHQMNHDLELFDFRLGEDFYRNRGVEPPRRAKAALRRETIAIGQKEDVDQLHAASISGSFSEEHMSSTPKQLLKSESFAGIGTSLDESPIFVQEKGEDGYRCPLENCRKLFRRDNLLVMHIKHYHPALLKKLGCKTLRVEDLATARTAFETEDAKSWLQAQMNATAPTTPASSPPRARQSFGSEKKLERYSSDVSDVLDSSQGPLAKRMCLGDIQQVRGAFLSSKARRKVDEDVNETSDLDSDLTFNMTGSEAPGSESMTTLLDDIPGQKELVHCFCGSPEEDGLMIQCELCLCWQHGICLSIDKEENVPDPYVCHFCRYPYRERLSQRYSHDQTWLKKGHLPTLKFISGSAASFIDGDRTLRVAHALTAAATDLKQLLHSLKVKIDIAKDKDHPKLYLWAQPWTRKTDSEHTDEAIDSNVDDVETIGSNESFFLVVIH